MSRKQRIVVKFGGSVLQDDGLLQTLCEEMVVLRHLGTEIVVVHGGGPAINQELKLRGIEWNFVEGLRVTTPEMMAVIETVLSGQVNKRIVRALYSAGGEAVGLSGVDGGILRCHQADSRLGQVGAIDDVRTDVIETVLQLKAKDHKTTIPVLAPIGLGANGLAYNINADWAAAKVAAAFAVPTLIFLTDQDGILDADRQLLAELEPTGIHDLIRDGVVQGGMLAKANTILHALAQGVRNVHVTNARSERPLTKILNGLGAVGTTCRRLKTHTELASESV